MCVFRLVAFSPPYAVAFESHVDVSSHVDVAGCSLACAACFHSKGFSPVAHGGYRPDLPAATGAT